VKSTILPCMLNNLQDDDETFVNIRINKKNKSVCGASRAGTVCEWDMNSYTCLHTHKIDGGFDEVEFSGSNFLAIEYATLGVWSLASGKCLNRVAEPTPFSVICLGRENEVFTGNGKAIQSWVTTPTALEKLHEYEHSCFGSVQHLAYGDNVVLSVASNNIMVWDIRSRERIRVLDEKAHNVAFNGKTIVALEGYGTVLKIIEVFHSSSAMRIKLPSLCSFSRGMCLEGNKLILPFGACVDLIDIKHVEEVFPSLDFSYFVNFVDTCVGSMVCGLENGTIQCLEF